MKKAIIALGALFFALFLTACSWANCTQCEGTGLTTTGSGSSASQQECRHCGGTGRIRN